MTWNWKYDSESIKPTRGRILIRPIGDPDKTGSIYIPPAAEDRPQKGEVLALGIEINEDIEVGDFILFLPWSDSARISLEPLGEQLAVIDVKLVLGVFTDE